MRDREALSGMILTWLHGRCGRLNAVPEPVDVPPELQALVTRHEPFRGQVLADARQWLAGPGPLGLGLRVQLPEALEIRAVPPWDEAIRPLKFSCSWADRMDPFSQIVESASYSMAAVVREDGQWRVAALWTDAERSTFAQQLALLAKVFGRA